MILYIDCEHPDLGLKDFDLARKVAAKHLCTKYRIESINEEPCLIVRFDRLHRALVESVKPRAVVCSGYYTDIEDYLVESLNGLNWLLREVPVPTLTICGSFQLMGRIWGADIGEMGPLECEVGDSGYSSICRDMDDELSPGMAKMLSHKHEIGFLDVDVTDRSVLFRGLSDRVRVRQNHYCEVKEVPEKFILIARSELCPIQGLAHCSLPLYGVQFHPEEYNDDYPDGRGVLENFLSSLDG